MFQALGFEVSYRKGAFRTKGAWNDSYTIPTPEQLKDALDWAKRSVSHEGNGQWIITEQPLGLHMDAELMVLVPAGNDRHTQLLAAVAYFEKVMAAQLGAPIDTTLRSIEDDRPKCEVCGQKPTWARTIRVLKFLDKDHFCSSHAAEQKDFQQKDYRHSVSSNYFWRHLGPTNT